MGKTQASKAIKIQRLREVRSLLILARPRYEIINELTQKWNCSERNVDYYINACKLLIQKAFEEETISDMNEKYDYLWEEALKDGDKVLAKQIIDSKTKLKGIVDKVEVKGEFSLNFPSQIIINNPNGGTEERK